MSTAIKHDEHKPQLDLLPVVPLIDIARVLTKGKDTYGRDNWRKGLAWSRCYAAALRHLFAWQSGETNDPETGLSHLAHAACEILFLLEFAQTHPELDDRPRPEDPFDCRVLVKEHGEIKPADAPSPAPLARSWIDCVKQFNRAYNIEAPTRDYFSIHTQCDLINEENGELMNAFTEWGHAPWDSLRDGETRLEILDAICDLIYVLIGLALKMGFDLDGAFREVHRSNMSKLGKDGKPIKREDGKVLKGPNYTPPKLEAFI